MKVKNIIISAAVVALITIGPSILAGLVEIPQVLAVLTTIVRIVGIVTIPILSVLAVILYKKERKEEKAKKRAHARYLAKKEFMLLEEELDEFREERRKEEVRDFFRTITEDSFLPTDRGRQQPASYPPATEFNSVEECLSYWNGISRKNRASKI